MSVWASSSDKASIVNLMELISITGFFHDLKFSGKATKFPEVEEGLDSISMKKTAAAEFTLCHSIEGQAVP